MGRYYIGMSEEPLEGSLAHEGIKGMRWGVRRFQYYDGRWTPEGKERYGSGKSTRPASFEERESILNGPPTGYTPEMDRRVGRSITKYDSSYKKVTKNIDPRDRFELVEDHLARRSDDYKVFKYYIKAADELAGYSRANDKANKAQKNIFVSSKRQKELDRIAFEKRTKMLDLVFANVDDFIKEFPPEDRDWARGYVYMLLGLVENEDTNWG